MKIGFDIVAAFGHKYKVVKEESYPHEAAGDDKTWHYRINGKHGHIYVYSDTALGAFVEGIARVKMVKNTGFKVLQDCDDEATFLVPPDQVKIIAAILKLYKKKQLSDAQKEALAAQGRKALAKVHQKSKKSTIK